MSRAAARLAAAASLAAVAALIPAAAQADTFDVVDDSQALVFETVEEAGGPTVVTPMWVKW